MSLDADGLREVAALAGLELTPEEQATLTQELSQVLDWMTVLSEAEEAPLPEGPGLRRRSDEEGLRVRPDELLRLAAEREGRLIRVPPRQLP